MKGQMLNRNKDIVCLILSYPPMNSVNRERHEVWIQNVLKINEMVREMEAFSEKEAIDALEISSQITRLLDHTWDDIEAYVPREIIDKMCKKTLEVDMSDEEVTMRLLSTGSTKQEAIPLAMSQDDIEIKMRAGVARHDEKRPMQEKLLNLVVDFSMRQILQEIKNPELLRIGISGRDGVRVTSALMNLPKIRETFDVVIQVDGSLHSTSTAIEENIAAQLGLSTWTGPKLDEFLKGTNFLIVLENIHEMVELYKLGTNWWNSKKIQKIVSMTRFCYVHQRMLLDLEISLDDHLLSWELFCLNVGDIVHSSVIQRLAIHAVKECRGHLLAIVLLARALKEVTEVPTWEYASHALAFRPTSQMKDEVLFNTLAFICGRLGNSEKNLLKYFVDMEYGGKLEKVNLIGKWITGDLIRKLDKGEKIVCDLVNTFLLESSWNGDSVFVQMRGEIHEALLNLLGLETKSLFLWLGGKGLTEPPKDEAWEKSIEVHLMSNKLSELPKSPDCPQLRILFLQINHHLRVIPPVFFEQMPILQILDLSHTRIRSLPQSISKLVQLRIFLLRGCRLLMELPPEVGELINLEVLDLEETEIRNLPMNVGRLTNLKSLKVSFYGHNNHNRKNNQSNTMIPQNVISKLLQLEELSIYVNPDDERWNVTVKDIVKEVCSFKRLETLKLYLPEVILLNDFMGNGTSSINLSSLNFRFIVGSHSNRFISRLPHEIAVKFEQQERCLKYVNGEGVPVEIKEVLRHATSLLLDRHLTLTKLSEFGIGNIKNLKFCVLGECSEIESIVDGAEIYTQGEEGGDVCAEIILGSLQYLRLHYMKNLCRIWKGPIQRGCLSNLKSLELHACPHLTTVFTLDLLKNLNILEELVVEHCPEISSIVTHEVPVEHRQLLSVLLVAYLPKLKKLSLHYMPKLVSLSNGLCIAPTLEWMSCYSCPNLQTLSDMEVSSYNLKAIIGQADWWRALKWSTSGYGYFLPRNLESIFVPVKQGIDLMAQLAEIRIQLLAPKQERKPPQKSGSNGSGKAPAVEAGTTSEEKQLYEPAPLSPFSTEEGGSIKAPAVEMGTSSKEKLLYEPASLPFPTEIGDSMKARAVEGGSTSEEEQLYEPVSLPFPREGGDSVKAPAVEGGSTSEEEQLYEPMSFSFPREGGDSVKAPAVEAGTTLKETEICEPAPSRRWKKLVLKLESMNDKIKNKAMKIVSGFPGLSSKYVSTEGNDQNSTSSKVSLASVPPMPRSEGKILQSPNLKNFTFAVLKRATLNFHLDGKLGEGGFGSVFKGWIDEHSFAAAKPGTGMVIAVKRLNLESVQGQREWLAEINYRGHLYHPHIVKLIGFCSEAKHRLMVYEYMARGSLENHLFGRGSYFEPLSWHLRLKVALGAAKGLAFLHSAERNVIHRDFKTSNILLDSNYDAKLSSFELARMGPTGGESHVSTRVVGTMGYIDPEYLATGHLTPKSDVYGFGVVLLEMLSGQRAVDWNRPPGEQNIVEWAKPYLKKKSKIVHIMDNRLEGQYSLEGAHMAAKLALQCLSPELKLRPSMNEVVAELEQLQDCKEPESTDSNSGLSSKYFCTEGNDENSTSSKVSLASVPSMPRSEGKILQSPNLKNFTFAELKRATRNFHLDSKLGEGGFGSVFKGWIDEHSFAAAKPGTGMVIAVKRLNLESVQGQGEWLAEINYLGQLYHPHIVKLIGFCSEAKHRLLVYECMPHGSLENHLFRRGSYLEPLSWHLRLKVALGAAKGLAFLHSAETNVIHRDFKTSNILLDSNYDAKLSGFGLAWMGPTGSESHVSTRVMGTMGYIDPEYLATGQLTTKSDVYSFGVVLLEMLSGQRAMEMNRPPEERHIVQWAKPYVNNRGQIFRIMDNRIECQYSLEGAHKAAKLALQCLSLDPEFRPSMNEVVMELEQLQDCEEPESTNSNPSGGAKHKRQSSDDIRNEKPDGNDQNSTSSKVSLASLLPTSQSEGDILQSPNSKYFTFAELKRATRNFCPDCMLGEGTFGSVFKGWIDGHSFASAKPGGAGMAIAVKRLKLENFLGHGAWLVELKYLGQLYHPHIVKLIGFCSEDEHRLLVYEYMAQGSLVNHLFKRGDHFEALSWHLRLKVALGAAKGLSFLHGAETQVIHRNIKPSNILLDSNYNAKLSNFEIARMGPTGGKSHVSTRVMGTPGYVDPEYYATGQLTAKSDVYSFGVVLLEMLSGRRAVENNRPPEERHIVQWAKPYVNNKGQIFRIMDNRLECRYPLEGALKAANLALQCLSSDPEFRPSMNEVVTELEQLQDCKEPESTNSNSSGGAKHKRQSSDDVRNEKPAAANPLQEKEFWAKIAF